MPLLIRNMAPTVMTAGFAKPAMASAGAQIPLTANTTMIPIEVRSTGSFSVISKYIAKIKIRVTSQMAIVFPHGIVVQCLCWLSIKLNSKISLSRDIPYFAF